MAAIDPKQTLINTFVTTNRNGVFVIKTATLILACALIVLGCSNESPPELSGAKDYFDNAGRDEVLSGGVKMIPVETPKGTIRVWTKRIGNNPTMKVLLLHGGPGATHEYLKAFDSFLPITLTRRMC